MSNTLTGTVKQILDEQSGTSGKGAWRKREFILETEGKFPKPVCLVQWGDEIDATSIREGDRITAHVDIQSREYNGRWYTDVKAWKIEKPDDAGAGAGQAPPPQRRPAEWDSGGDDDLPF